MLVFLDNTLKLLSEAESSLSALDPFVKVFGLQLLDYTPDADFTLSKAANQLPSSWSLSSYGSLHL